jgi:hypothetical protein
LQQRGARRGVHRRPSGRAWPWCPVRARTRSARRSGHRPQPRAGRSSAAHARNSRHPRESGDPSSTIGFRFRANDECCIPCPLRL